MKKIFPVLLTLLLCFSAAAQAPEVIKLKKDVIDYYWEMSSVDKDLVSYPLEIKGKKWTTVSVGDYEMEADVNISKGYIFIKDPARDTLDKSCSFQFMLFEKSKGEPIIGISKKVFSGLYWDTDISFWKKNGGKWFKVNDEVMTELNYRDFLEGGNDGFIHDEHVAKMMPLHYELPQKGKTIKIFLLDEYFKIYCLSVKSDDPACGIQGSFKDEELQLQWNKSKGKFILLDSN
jgi:hypothetical protein